MTSEHYILLFQKSLSGEITPEEQKRLDAWLAESPENQRIANTVRKAWELSGNFSEDVPLDLDADFAKIKSRMGEAENAGGKVRQMQSRRRWMSIAAALLVLVATPFLIKNFFSPSVNFATVATAGEALQKAIELPDGSRVWLNADSELAYFTEVGKERRVKLTGEAFFEVAKDAARPFVVETTAGEVTVLGTSFSVKNVDSENDFTVHVATGRVQMSPEGTAEKLILTKNESGVFQKKEGQLRKLENENLNELSWHTRSLKFADTPLSEALSEISGLYGVNIEMESESLRDCTLNASFQDKKFTSVKAALETMLGAEMVETRTGEYTLKGGKCE